MNIESVTDRATLLFRQHGTLRTSEAMALGIHPRTLYALHHEGILERLGPGLYRLSDLPPLSDPDPVTGGPQSIPWRDLPDIGPGIL